MINMDKNLEKNLVPPIEEKRVRTTLNLSKTNIDGLSKIATAKKVTLTAMMDEAISTALSVFNDTTLIDRMLRETNGYIFNRDLDAVKQKLNGDIIQKLTPFQKAYLYTHLKDANDALRVFEALGFSEDLDEINVVNSILEKASKFRDQQFIGYSIPMLANETKAALSVLQAEYLQAKIGIEAIAKLKEWRPDLFQAESAFIEGEQEPVETSRTTKKQRATAFKDSGDKEQAFDEATMNPALETVLAVTALSKEAWQALPDGTKKQIHEAVKTGKLDILKKLVAGVAELPETVELFAQQG